MQNDIQITKGITNDLLSEAFERNSKRQKLAPSGTKDDPFTVIPKKRDRVIGAYYTKGGILRYWNGQMRFPCDVGDCIYECKDASHLKVHKESVHNINVTWHACGVGNCKYKCKRADNLKVHKTGVHNINVTWHACGVGNCKYKCKQACGLKQHKAHIHNINVTWHACGVGNCKYKCKRAKHLKQHKAGIHDIDVVWHACDVNGCNFKCKRADNLKSHKTGVHDINIVWRACDVNGCNFKCKQACGLKQHRADVHNIDVVWCACDVNGCNYEGKRAGTLKQHKAGVHDIGALECEICYKMCGRTLRHEFTYGNTASTGVVDVCRQCCLDYGFKKDRIEHRYMEKLDGYIDFPAYDDQTVHGNACFRYRPDRLYLDAHMRVHIHLECDEGQHMWSSGSYDCEEKRISDIYDEFANTVPRHYVVVRFNPDEYDKNDADRDEVFEERVKHVAEIVQFVRGNPPPERISIVYMYYSTGNPQIAKNLPVYFVDDERRGLKYV